ncbi:MAG TPA: ATP-binding protein [Prolixibacteraceae bacterium]|nr:ATP-binding protein [Prolixibacteraceae bacterium]HPS11915.1 ATP-binding protein [Prolixibacteraceae bacterium]
MNIKTKLSLQFTLLVGTILLVFSLLTYYFTNTNQQSKFNADLLQEAKNTVILLIDVAEVDSTLLKKIQHSTYLLKEEEIKITDSSSRVIYSNNVDILSNHFILNNLPGNNPQYFSIEHKNGVAFKHTYKGTIYYVYILAFDQKRTENLADLRSILIWSILFSLWLSVLFSYIFSRNAMKPISNIIRNVKEINSSQLNSRLDEGNKKDEIGQLAITFNELLTDLEIVFRNQEEFVSNASHELRTPLTVMIGETDYLLSLPRTSEEYLAHIKKLSTDLRELNALINSLLELAQLNKDNTIQFNLVRIDEIVYSAIHQIKTKYPNQKIVLKITYPDNEEELVINGNSGLLNIAFKNLIDNACKFSSEDVLVEFISDETSIIIRITDKGIGIPANELEKIFKPFNRASNVKFKSGFGIGLALVSKIIELHGGEISIESNVNEGTLLELTFQKQTSQNQ